MVHGLIEGTDVVSGRNYLTLCFRGAAQLNQSINVLICLSRADPAKLSRDPEE